MKTFFRFSSWMTILIIASIVGTHAQNAFFPTKQGMVLLYARKDGSGKVKAFTRTTIQNVEGSGNNMTISCTSEVLTKDRKSTNPPSEMPLKIVIKDGVMILDMQEYFAEMNSKTPQGKMEMTGIPMEIPSDLQAGQSLKDADVTTTVDLGIMKVKMEVKMTDGKCLAIEEVTVPAGTFKCHKIEQSVSTTATMMGTIKSRTITWYAPGIGSVRGETYDDKGKLKNIMELAEMN